MQITGIKKTILLSLLLLASGAACAEWLKFSETASYNFYINPDTIRMDGKLIKVWLLNDYKNRSETGGLSSRVKIEIDCSGERIRTLTLSEHSEHMAGGELTFTGKKENDWRDVAPDTVNEKALKLVCAK